jgi:PAS domain S-box-containing protein
VVIPYVVFASLYIWLSDHALNWLTREPRYLKWLQSVKGTGFVVITGILLFVLLRRELRQRQDLSMERERLESSLQIFIENVEEYSIVFLDLEGRINTWNAGAERIIGYRAEEALGRHYRLFHPPDEAGRRAADAALQQAAASGVHHESGWLVRRDRSRFWASVTIRTVRDPEGHLRGFAAVTRDETERRRAEEELRQREEEYRLLFDRTPHPMWVLDLESHRFLAVNKAATEHYGYSQESFLTMSLTDILPPDEMVRLPAAWSESSHLTGTGRLWRHRRKDGSLIDVELASHQISFGGCRARLVMALDVTEERSAIQALRESEERYHTLAAISPVGIFRTDPDGRCIYVNERWCDITGLRAGEALGTGWSGLLFPESRQTVLEQWRLAANAGKNCEMESRFTHPDGHGVAVLAQVTAIQEAPGRITGYVGTITDMTSRKAAENALRELTSRLLVVQDEERRRLARELHDTTSQNLAALAINLAMLSQSPTPLPERAAALLQDCVLLANDTAKEIRTLSHILHPPLLEVAGLRGALRELARGFSSRSGIQIETDLPEDFGRLSREHESALLRVAQEGLANIHRHSNSRTGRLRLRRDTETVSLEIEDDGDGVPPDRLAALQRDDRVVGVGIAGMRERLRQLGGQLILTSGNGGTQVRALLPFSAS